MKELLMRKKNRQIRVATEEAKESYLRDGYDVINLKGEVVEPAVAGKTYTATQYNKLLDENKKLKAENKKLNAK